MVILPHSGGGKFSEKKIQKQKSHFFNHFAKTKQYTGGKSDTNEYKCINHIRDTCSLWKTKRKSQKTKTIYKYSSF